MLVQVRRSLAYHRRGAQRRKQALLRAAPSALQQAAGAEAARRRRLLLRRARAPAAVAGAPAEQMLDCTLERARGALVGNDVLAGAEPAWGGRRVRKGSRPGCEEVEGCSCDMEAEEQDEQDEEEEEEEEKEVAPEAERAEAAPNDPDKGTNSSSGRGSAGGWSSSDEEADIHDTDDGEQSGEQGGGEVSKTLTTALSF